MTARLVAIALPLLLAASLASAEPATPPAPSAAAPIPLAELAKRYIAWRGGAAFTRAKTLHTAGTVEAFGLTGKIENWQSPQHWLNYVDLGGVVVREVITRKQSWSTNASGQAQSEPDAFKYASRDPQSADSLASKGGAKASVLGMEVADGRTWEVVRVSFGDADTYDDFLDPRTGALDAMRASEKGQRRFEHYSDWRLVHGVRMPFVARLESDLGVQTGTLTLCEVDGPIDPALFSPPPSGRHISFAADASGGAWTSFLASQPDRIYLSVTLNGRATTALFDTGATSSIVDQRLATVLDRAAIGALPAPGENGLGSVSLVRGIDLGIGDVTLNDLTVGSMDVVSMSSEPWQAVVGDEVLNEAIVDMDLPHRRIAFHDPATYRPPAEAITVQLVRDGTTRLVPMSIDRGPQALFLMDTGFNGPLRIAPSLTRQQNLLAGQPSTTTSINAIGGQASTTLASLSTVELGGITFKSTPAYFSDTWPSATYTDRVQGLLGMGLLERFRVIADWPRDRLYLIPTPDAATAPFARDRLGLTLRAEGDGAEVMAVAANSPAAAAGFKVGQLIETIDGQPAAKQLRVGWQAAGDQLTFVGHAEGQPLAVTNVTLKDFY